MVLYLLGNLEMWTEDLVKGGHIDVTYAELAKAFYKVPHTTNQ